MEMEEKVRERRSKRVLSEEEYVDSIERIIRRDYFPDVDKLKLQEEWLVALHNKDFPKLAELREEVARLKGLRSAEEIRLTPSLSFDSVRTEALIDNEYSDDEGTSASAQSSADAKNPTDGLSLDKFLALFSSEDEESFNELMKKRKQERENLIRLLRGYKERDSDAEQPLLEGRETKLLTDSGTKGNEAGGKALSEFRIPEPLTSRAHTEQTALLLFPEGIEQPLSENDRRKEVVAKNTRFSKKERRKRSLAESLNESLNGDLVRKYELVGPEARKRMNADSLLSLRERLLMGRASLPGSATVDGYDILPEQSKEKEGISDGEESLQRWIGTPLELELENPIDLKDGNRSALPQVSEREVHALELAKVAEGRMRDRRRKYSRKSSNSLRKDVLKTQDSTPDPNTTPRTPSRAEQIRMLSPAARRLARRNLRS